MHLHGFFFDVESIGDGSHDQAYASAQRPRRDSTDAAWLDDEDGVDA